ncbi:hypothetical protein GE115_02395 [Agromyces sp. CFH 90414]|uniref:Tetratricopeptide repeat protein n=1 Tax=Agromyces agglutinans TaxID=2662258 RepID=A0A6I2F4R8_9MICO|nr:hypothetical protein [Agromyces agglutinans]MRG58727.1 hypothetical protein [Agromyces agglutinans]
MDASTDPVPADPSRHPQREEQHVIDRLWDFSDPAASEERFRAAADDDTFSNHIRQAMATQLARAVGIQRRFDEGLAVLDAVSAELEAAGESEVPAGAAGAADQAGVADPADAADAADAAEAAEVRARVALERGRLLASARRPDEAVPELTRAVREAAHAGSTFLVLDALHMLALTDTGHEREWAEQGFEVLRADREPRVLRWGVALHHNLGWTLHDGGDAAAGLEQFELAVGFADRYGTVDQQHVTRWSVGRALRTLGRTDEALELQRELARAKPDDPYVAGEIEALTAAKAAAESSPEPGASAGASREPGASADR